MMTTNLETIHVLRKLGLQPRSCFMRDALVSLAEYLMEWDLSRNIDASPYERSNSRKAYRNGYRTRRWKTPFGQTTLRIPKLRTGTYSPEFLSQSSTVMLSRLLTEVYCDNLRPDSVANFLTGVGLSHIPDFAQEQIRTYMHDLVTFERSRPLAVELPYLWFDAIRLNTKSGPRVMLVAVAFDDVGCVHILDFELSRSSDDEQVWHTFMKRLRARLSTQIQLVAGGDWNGLRRAAEDTFVNAEWTYKHSGALQELLYLISENNRGALVDAVSNLTFPVIYRTLSNPSHSELGWQPQAIMALAVA